MPDVTDLVKHLEQVIKSIESAEVVPAVPEETLRNRVSAVVIWFLSKSVTLAEVFLLSKGVSSVSHGSSGDNTKTLLTLASWSCLHEARVLDALSDMDNSSRVDADCFLVRSLVAQYIQHQNQKGLSVASREAIDLYLKCWTYRPVAEKMKVRLVRLTHHTNARRKFGQLLRREWMLEFGGHSIAPDLLDEETTARALRATTKASGFHRSFD
jgi:hypothetical protein